jgi:hypothetical protein
MNEIGKPDRPVRSEGLSSPYAANSEPVTPAKGDLANDAMRVLLPDEPPPLTPEAARAMLRLLLTLHQQDND